MEHEATVQKWKPNPKYAALLAEPAPADVPQPHVVTTHDWGFGARGANKAWTSPTEKPVPTDWWKKAA